MSATQNQIQLYNTFPLSQSVTILQVQIIESLETIDLPPPLLPHNPPPDPNPLMLNLEVFLVAFLLLALPILIYLAYRYGKKMGRKEHGPTPYRNGAPEEFERQFSEESTSSNSWHHNGVNNSKNSSTHSSPALARVVVPKLPQIKDNGVASPITSDKNKRELSVQTEDEKIEEFSLGERNCEGQSEKNCQIVPLEKKKSSNGGNKENYKFVYTYSAGHGEQEECKGEVFEEKVKLHSQDSQVLKKEVTYGISLEKKGEVFEKTEIKEVKTVYDPLCDLPEKNAEMLRENYQNSPILSQLFFSAKKQPEQIGKIIVPALPICVEEAAVKEKVGKGGNSSVTNGTTNGTYQPTVNTFSRKDSERAAKVISRENTTTFGTNEEKGRMESVVEKYGVPDETGKFHKIFKDVEWIGEGSFGEVYKVVHRLDGKIYAVKKVKLKLGRFEELKKESKVFREVFAMTDLHHPNIVRYSTCWVEIEWDKDNHQESREKFERSRTFNEPVNLGDISENEGSEEDCSEDESELVERSRNSDLGFEWDVSAGICEKKEKSKKVEKKHRVKGFLKRRKTLEKPGQPGLKRKNSNLLIKTLSKSFIEEEIDELSKNSSHSRVESLCEVPGCKLFLYIQMEYCAGQSLKYYLENSRTKIIKHKALEMFKKLIEGVHSIHSRGILHRDLKPANIFLDGNENVKIGDFGLASLDKFDEQMEGLTPKEKAAWKSRKLHSMKVGTPMYTSPEQESGGHYDQKTDVYSLGLIFYELLNVFSTHHERYEHFGWIREKCELPPLFKKKFAAESEIILRMTAISAVDRPTTAELMVEVEKLLEQAKLHECECE